jgi:chorismate mutase
VHEAARVGVDDEQRELAGGERDRDGRRRQGAAPRGHPGHSWHDPAPMRLFALRGATTVDRNEPDAILAATETLMRQIMERNGLGPADVVSCIFTLTNDLDAEFPAVAARKLGFDRVPLLCAREVPVPGSLPMVIRVLIHYYAEEGHEATHVYLGEARRLREDLEAAQ